MFSGIGLPELLIILVVGLLSWAIPIAFAVWVVISLGRINRTQTEILDRLDELTRDRDRTYR